MFRKKFQRVLKKNPFSCRVKISRTKPSSDAESKKRDENIFNVFQNIFSRFCENRRHSHRMKKEKCSDRHCEINEEKLMKKSGKQKRAIMDKQKLLNQMNIHTRFAKTNTKQNRINFLLLFQCRFNCVRPNIK